MVTTDTFTQFQNTESTMRIFFLFLILLISTKSFEQVNLSQGLIAHFPFNGNANDISGNALNGVISNAILTADKDGTANSAYYFNGANSYITLPFSNLYNLNPQDSFSISVWILPDLANPWPAQSLVVKAPYNPDFNLSSWNYGSYMLNYKAMSGYAYNHVLNGTSTLSNDPCWYNIITTYKNGIWKLYVNGALESSDLSQTKFILKDGTSKIVIGRKGESSGDYYKGKMDEVRLYNRVLNFDEVKAIFGNCQRQVSCDNWLELPSFPSAVSLGDLDIAGNQITVEAMFVRTTPYNNGYNWAGDLVSKHVDPGDVNYLLRPNNAEITTSNGYYSTPQICEIELNRMYHAAMVYNGSTLKFYRNGFLMSSIPASGNLYQNNHLTKIGLYDALVHNTNLIGYINEVRIWNVARTQTEIKNYMNSSLPYPTAQTGLVAYYTFDNLINKQGTTTWNGTLTGAAQINQVNPTCNFIADSCRTAPCPIKNDFSFSFNPCNPNNVSFLTSATGYNNIRWDFGDGNTASSTTSPQNTYSSQGNYVVTMITDYATCTDTVTKNITIAIQNDNLLISTNDTTICSGQTKQLLTSPGLSYCWSPATYLNNTSVSNPVTSTPQSITYYLQSATTGNNLIVNGDFSLGNTGFYSDYLYSPSSGFNPGVYNVGSNITVWHSALSPCNDHTTGSNNMLMVNGSTDMNIKVWSQSISVIPNTNYAFSTWLQHITNSNPAKLQFSINGNNIGNIFQANSTSCIWEQFNSIWNSGNNTTAVISIVNQNNIYTGNDFALDDISFSPITIRRDSVRITVDTPLINATHHANICLGDTVHLNVTGAVTYSWSPPTGLTNTSISNPVASPAANTTYVATGINANGCADTDTVRIAVRIPVPFTVNPPVSLCKNLSAQLTAAGGDTYLWSPANLLSNSVISNPVATAPSTTTFSVLITDTLCNNSSTLSTTVNVFPDPNIIINKSNDIDCSHLSATLSASGGASYSWAPSNTLNNPNLPNPVASPKVTTDYIVTVTDANDCTNKDSITVYVTDSNKGDYLMPSGFTPNNDGLNDCFGIKYWGLIEKLEFSIYNRWGERVFFTTDPAGCWDGTYKGQQQDGAVFVYMIKAKTACQDNIFRKGTFVLIR